MRSKSTADKKSRKSPKIFQIPLLLKTKTTLRNWSGNSTTTSYWIKTNSMWDTRSVNDKRGGSIVNYTAPSDKRQEKSKESWKEKVKKTIEADTDTSSESDCKCFQHTARHVLNWAKKVRSGRTQDTVLITIGDLDVHIEPNSRASVNVVDEYQFRALKYRSKEIRELDPGKDTLKTLQSHLGVITIQNKNWGAKSKFLVIAGKMDSPPLLSKNTLIELAMIKIDPNGTLKETNEL